MSSKKIFFLLFLSALACSRSYAAYNNPWKIDDYQAIKKAESMGDELVNKQAAFWRDLKLYFTNNQACHHKLRGYLSIIEYLFDQVLAGNFSQEAMVYGWKNLDIVNSVFHKHFTQEQSFYAYILLRNMILSSALFNMLEKNSHDLNNGLKTFWGPVQDIFNSDRYVHRICFFCEVLIFLKNLESALNAQSFNSTSEYITQYKEFRAPHNLINNLKSKWNIIESPFWSKYTYKLIENFCLNSQIFRELEK
jgi:hypothetical protein